MPLVAIGLDLEGSYGMSSQPGVAYDFHSSKMERDQNDSFSKQKLPAF